MKTLNEYMKEAEEAIDNSVMNKERKVKIKASKDFLHENLPNLLDTDIKQAVTILVGKRGKKTDWMEDIIQVLMNQGSIDEDTLFIEHKKGRHEMRQVIKYATTKGIGIELIDGEYLIKDIQNV